MWRSCRQDSTFQQLSKQRARFSRKRPPRSIPHGPATLRTSRRRYRRSSRTHTRATCANAAYAIRRRSSGSFNRSADQPSSPRACASNSREITTFVCPTPRITEPRPHEMIGLMYEDAAEFVRVTKKIGFEQHAAAPQVASCVHGTHVVAKVRTRHRISRSGHSSRRARAPAVCVRRGQTERHRINCQAAGAAACGNNSGFSMVTSNCFCRSLIHWSKRSLRISASTACFTSSNGWILRSSSFTM
jgi:hypothetical protein